VPTALHRYIQSLTPENTIRCVSEYYTETEIDKGKGKGQPRKDHEGPEEEWKYSSTLSVTSELCVVGGQRHAPAALQWRIHGTHCTGGWVGPKAVLEKCGKSRPHQDSIPGPSIP